MAKYFTFLFIMVFLGQTGYSQRPSAALKDVYADAEFFLMEEFYDDALAEFQKIYNRGYSENANINYKIGVCMINIPGMKDDAVGYLEFATTNTTDNYIENRLSQEQAPQDAWLYLGNAYRINNNLNDAARAYNKYLTLLDMSKDEMLADYTNKQLESVKIAREMEANPVNVEFINLGPEINNASANYNPVISPDGNAIYYMTELKFYHAIYMAEKVDGEWQSPYNLTPDLRSDGDLFTNFISHNGENLLLNRETNFNSNIFISQKEGDAWGIPKEIGNKINTKFWESHASISPDGNILYFASNSNDGLGGTDIYISNRQSNGNWSEPVNLGKTINTPLNEDRPMIAADGKKLFFSSQGHRSMGGYDLYYTVLQPDGSWTKPINLGYPISTTDDDLYFYPESNSSDGYVARIITDVENYGNLDIYKVKYITEDDVMILTEEATEEKPLETVEPEVTIAEKTTEEEPAAEQAPPPAAEEEKTPPKKPDAAKVKATVETVYFSFDKVSLTPESKEKVDNLAQAMKESGKIKVEIIGHTDSKGPESYNMALSESRAKSVADYLISLGVNANNINYSGKGETQPIADETNPDGSDNPEARRYNRRVEYRVTQGDDMINVKEPDVPEKFEK